MSNMVIHKADSRGHANHGWLDSYHTFSFAQYYDPARTHFGVLRVLNDDTVSAGRGFDTHPHQNMEIISIPLEGDLEHKDSMGHTSVIRKGDVQVMSAGTGVRHSEYNKNRDQKVKFLQIWIFPRAKNVQPRYGQQAFDANDRTDRFQQVVSPNPDGDGLWIHQDTWLHLGNLGAGFSGQYQVKKSGNGVYAFVIEGEVCINGQHLERRDGMGISDVATLDISTASGSELLLIEVPMEIPSI